MISQPSFARGGGVYDFAIKVNFVAKTEVVNVAVEILKDLAMMRKDWIMVGHGDAGVLHGGRKDIYTPLCLEGPLIHTNYNAGPPRKGCADYSMIKVKPRCCSLPMIRERACTVSKRFPPPSCIKMVSPPFA